MFTEIEKPEYIIKRSRSSLKENKFNLLDIPAIKILLFWKAFPFIFQAVILFVLFGFIVLGWGVYSPEGQDEELFAKSNLVTMIIWGIWWPLMILTVVVLGRLWCMVCPLELVNRIGGRVGDLLKIKKLSANGTIKSGFIIVSLYALIQFIASGTGLHYVPAYTAIFLTCLIAFSTITGIFFKTGTFCKGFCPVAMTLNAYSRGSMLSVRAGSVEKCAECKTKSCVRNADGRSILRPGGGCPVNLYPPQLKSNKDCMLCAQCIKSCKSGNLQLLLRPPFNKQDQRERGASWALTLFIMMDSGFVLGEICEEWALTGRIFTAVPQFFLNYFDILKYSGWIEGVWALFIVPLLLWTLAGIIFKSTGAVKSIIYSWRNFAFRAVIISSSLHLIKSLLRFSEWSAYLPYAVKDPEGINNLRAFSSGVLPFPQSAFNHLVIIFISIAVLSSSLYFFIREKHLGNI